jgi:uncharacterized short protein YbdD (DUF466 family)
MPDIRTLGAWVAQTARLMIGIPDYETYVEHQRTFHPDDPVHDL